MYARRLGYSTSSPYVSLSIVSCTRKPVACNCSSISLDSKNLKIQRNLVPPQFVLMNGFFSNVEREQQSTAGPEHSFEFQKCLRQFLRCEVNNRVEGGNGSAGIIRYFERQHVALKKLNFWCESSSKFDHAR